MPFAASQEAFCTEEVGQFLCDVQQDDRETHNHFNRLPLSKRVSKEVQPSRYLLPVRVTAPSLEKSMVVTAAQLSKKQSPRLVILPNPAKSMEVNDLESDKKKSPRLVTLLNPVKSMVVNASQLCKK